MDDFDFEKLEVRLRRVVSGRRLDPPGDLLDFIETVPRLHAGRNKFAPSLGLPAALARGLALVAMAIVVGAVATQAIVTLRPTQPGGGSSWSWYAPRGPQLRAIRAQLPNGYVGDCSSGEAGIRPCSSRDGVNWTAPIDPAVATLKDGDADAFLPGNVYEIGGAWVGTAMGGGSGSLIRSSDGSHWTSVHSADIDSVLGETPGVSYYSQLAGLADRFMLIAWIGGGEGWAFTSTDGANWTRASKLPASWDKGLTGYGAVGFFLYASDGSKAWRTVDGASWSQVDSGWAALRRPAVAVPSGGYIAQEFSTGRILKSDDGSSWRADQGDLVGYPVSMTAVGGRVLASVTATPHDGSTWTDASVWESLDWGKTWRKVIGPDGTQLAGSLDSTGDALEILQGDGLQQHVAYVGLLGSRTIASPAPATPIRTATPTPEPAVPTRLPDALRSEWTWRKMDRNRFEGAIAVPGGWIAICSAPGTDDFAAAALCSSKDGLSWSNPADPGMVQEQGQGFWPLGGASVNGVYLAYSLQHWIPFEGEGIGSLWRSTDGHSWRKLTNPAFEGMKLDDLGIFKGQFVTVATGADGNSAILLASSDGLTWTKLGDMPAVPNSWSVTDFGILLDSNTVRRDPSNNWLSRDGVSWTHVELPEGVTDLGGSPVHLPDGSYIDIGWDFATAMHETLVTSTDGATWQALATQPAGTFMGLESIDGRLILNMALGESNEGPYAVWQSSDGGKTWQSLPDPEGFPATGFVSSFGDGLVIKTTDDVPAWWLGTLTAR
jgi:hypothetical protein